MPGGCSVKQIGHPWCNLLTGEARVQQGSENRGKGYGAATRATQQCCSGRNVETFTYVLLNVAQSSRLQVTTLGEGLRVSKTASNASIVQIGLPCHQPGRRTFL